MEALHIGRCMAFSQVHISWRKALPNPQVLVYEVKFRDQTQHCHIPTSHCHFKRGCTGVFYSIRGPAEATMKLS